MRTTVRLDDELLERLKAQAREEKVSLTRLLNRALKAEAAGGASPPAEIDLPRTRPRHGRSTPFALDKALALAAAREDEEIVRARIGRLRKK